MKIALLERHYTVGSLPSRVTVQGFKGSSASDLQELIHSLNCKEEFHQPLEIIDFDQESVISCSPLYERMKKSLEFVEFITRVLDHVARPIFDAAFKQGYDKAEKVVTKQMSLALDQLS